MMRHLSFLSDETLSNLLSVALIAASKLNCGYDKNGFWHYQASYNPRVSEQTMICANPQCKRPRSGNSRFCFSCKSMVLDKMHRDGYLRDNDEQTTRVIALAQKKREAKSQRGKA